MAHQADSSLRYSPNSNTPRSDMLFDFRSMTTVDELSNTLHSLKYAHANFSQLAEK